jgi:hypothetical protein
MNKAPSMWQELKDKIQEKASDLNSHYGEAYVVVQPLDIDKLLVQSPKRSIDLRFEPITPEVIFPSIDPIRGLKFHVSNGEVEFRLVGGAGANISTEGAAVMILNHVIQRR